MEKRKATNTGHVMEDIDRFCTCPICKKHLNDPRRLPCAHRYCLRCLDRSVRGFQAKNQGQFFPCPKCRQEFPIPLRGAVDMKKDFWVTEMLNLTDLRDKLASGTKSGTCCCCMNEEELIALCTDCDGYVCLNCCNLHERIGVLKSHNNIFKLDNNMKQNKGKIDMKKLLAITAAPKCSDHKGMELELSCRTCENCLICLKCALVGHADHEKQDVEDAVKSLSEELHRERVSVSTKRQTSLACRKQNEKNVEKIKFMFDNITSGIESKYKFGMKKCEEEEQILTSADSEGIENIESCRDIDVMAFEKKAEESVDTIKRELTKRINAINEDLAVRVKNRKNNAQRQLDVIEARMNAKKKGINEKRQQLNEDHDKLLYVVSSCKQSVSAQLIDCNKSIDETLIRLQYLNENLTTVEQVSSDWSFVETVSDLLFTMGNMNKSLDDIHRVSQSLNTPVLAFDPKKSPYQIGNLMWTIKRQFRVVPAGRFGKDQWKIDDITSVTSGSIAVAGASSGKESAIDFITHGGQTTRAKDFLFEDNDPWCLCKADDHRMVACRGANVEVLDIDSGESLRKINMKRIPRWRPDDRLVSVAYDGNMNEVMVCRQKSIEVFVFDRDLKYLRSFKMPGPSKGPFSMIVSGDVLLACTLLKDGYGIGVDLGTTTVINKYKPIESGHRALGICCDSGNCVYILWKRESDVWVVHYDCNGDPILGLPVHPQAVLADVVKSKDGTEDLIVTTPDGRMAFYKLPLRKTTSLKHHSAWFVGIEQDVLDRYLSHRFHWETTAQKYDMKESFDIDLSDRVEIPVTPVTPVTPATPPPPMDVPASPISANTSRDYTLLV